MSANTTSQMHNSIKFINPQENITPKISKKSDRMDIRAATMETPGRMEFL